MRVSRAFVLAFAIAGTARAQPTPPAFAPAPAWTRGSTCYEVFVRSFYDSNGDGIGDLNGLTAKLAYIDSLGARCIWLMPVMQSPSYHGYDITDYYSVARDYGTNDDFKRFVAAAHARGIKVLIDMVLNHTSNQHPWFQSALHDTTSPYRNWYRFSATKPNETGPWGQPVWHKSPVRDEYYYGVFYDGMPDLNYREAAVVAESRKIARYWVEQMGVDGFRLDAVPYLVEDPGQLQHTRETHDALRDYAAFVRSVKPDAYTIGEVFAPTDSMLPYFPEQLDAYFDFEVADSLIAAARRGTAGGVLAPMLRLQRDVPAWRLAPFLRNHDQPRTRTQLGVDSNAMNRARVAAFMLLTMPGVPFVYYGEEIGMAGDKPDERIRTPMQWAPMHAGGFSAAAAWERLQDDSMTVNVANEAKDPHSLLALYRRLIHLRSTNDALAAGELIPLTTNTNAVVAYLRRDGPRAALVIINLGTAPAANVALSSAPNAAPIGSWRLVDLLSGATASPLTVRATRGLENYAPFRTLPPFTGYVFDLRAK